MSDTPMTVLSLSYAHEDGSLQSLGGGTIDQSGRIVIDAPAPGQEDYVASFVEEMNAREFVVVKERPGGGHERRYAMVKRQIERVDPDFLSALKTYARRVFGMVLDFDEEALAPPERGSQTSGLASRNVPAPPPDEELAALEAEMDADEVDEGEDLEELPPDLLEAEEDASSAAAPQAN